MFQHRQGNRHKRKAYKRKREYIEWRRSNATNHSPQKTIVGPVTAEIGYWPTNCPVDTLPTAELWLPGSQSGVNCQLIKRLAVRSFVLNYSITGITGTRELELQVSVSQVIRPDVLKRKIRSCVLKRG